MDACCNIENIQIHLNNIETIYQKTSNAHTYPCFFLTITKKICFSDKFISLLNPGKSSTFLDEYLKKMWYFFPSFWYLKNWFYFWALNSFDLTFNKDQGILKENVYNILKNSNFLCSYMEYNFPTSNSLLSLYAGTMAFVCMSKKIYSFTYSNLLEIYLFVKKLKTKKGSFRSSFLGESDSRVNYCVFIILSLYNILTPEISANCEKYVRNIQMNDGSFSENKLQEGHGAFFYCCIANLIFFSQKNDLISLPTTYVFWINQKMNLFDFSIQGRTSKLTDCCYFFWIGAATIIGSIYLHSELVNGLTLPKDEISAGYSDKIGRNLDLYHTCYALCGLSVLSFTIQYKEKFPELRNNGFTKLRRNFVNCKLSPMYGIRESKLLQFFY
nr:geranylgeranyl transferase [Cryptomonas sp.]